MKKRGSLPAIYYFIVAFLIISSVALTLFLKYGNAQKFEVVNIEGSTITLKNIGILSINEIHFRTEQWKKIKFKGELPLKPGKTENFTLEIIVDRNITINITNPYQYELIQLTPRQYIIPTVPQNPPVETPPEIPEFPVYNESEELSEDEPVVSEQECIPLTEVCDGEDNNCDGIIDEGCECIDGQTQDCGIDIGECEFGTSTCINGHWGECQGGVDTEDEICDDGLDNDCNGLVDDC